MHFSTSIFLSIAATAIAAPLAAPQDDGTSIITGSNRNVYLSTCRTYGLLDSDTSSAVIYYNGPASANTSPADVGVVSEPARPWAGQKRTVRLTAGTFTSTVDAGANELPKSSLAGTAKLGNEDFVCFRDGSSTFQLREGLLGIGRTTCKADFWCASIDVLL